jgi:hypothetical protein
MGMTEECFRRTKAVALGLLTVTCVQNSLQSGTPQDYLLTNRSLRHKHDAYQNTRPIEKFKRMRMLWPGARMSESFRTSFPTSALTLCELCNTDSSCSYYEPVPHYVVHPVLAILSEILRIGVPPPPLSLSLSRPLNSDEHTGSKFKL